MLKLFWKPGPACVPAEPAGQALTDTLSMDDETAGPRQTIRRADAGFPALAPDLAARLDGWLAQRADPGGPAFVLVHGFQYDPRDPPTSADSPFGSIYGVPAPGNPGGPDPHLSVLPLVGECDDAGGNQSDVAIAFAWASEGSLTDDAEAGWDNDYKYAALDLSPAAAKALAAVLAHLATRRVAVRLLAHSLGTRTTSQAIGLLAAAARLSPLERAVLLGGAEFSVDVAANFAGCAFDVVNVGSRQDTVLVLGEQMCHPVRPNATWSSFVIGRNGLGGNERWIDLQLDSPPLANWFAGGNAPTGTRYALAGVALTDVHPLGFLNHWAYYTNAGNRVLVRDLMTAGRMNGVALAAAGVPNGFDCPEYDGFIGQAVRPTPTTRDGRAVHVGEAHGRGAADV
jgi:hypothetical protein